MAFSCARPITGTLQLDCTEAVQAYGIEIAFVQRDYSCTWTKRTHKSKNGRTHTTYTYYSDTKESVIVRKIVTNFADKVCLEGKSEYPFTVEVPPRVAQSLWGTKGVYPRCYIKHCLKAQLISINTDAEKTYDFDMKDAEKVGNLDYESCV